MQLEITIEGELPDLNEIIAIAKKHPKAYAKAKSMHTEAVAWGCAGVPKGQLKMPVDVTCTWVTKNLRKDPDNVSAGIKFVLDGLVQAGVLPGDGRKQISSISHRFGVDKLNPRVEIVLTEAV
jgi:hypothetical protein